MHVSVASNTEATFSQINLANNRALRVLIGAAERSVGVSAAERWPFQPVTTAVIRRTANGRRWYDRQPLVPPASLCRYNGRRRRYNQLVTYTLHRALYSVQSLLSAAVPAIGQPAAPVTVLFTDQRPGGALAGVGCSQKRRGKIPKTCLSQSRWLTNAAKNQTPRIRCFRTKVFR